MNLKDKRLWIVILSIIFIIILGFFVWNYYKTQRCEFLENELKTKFNELSKSCSMDEDCISFGMDAFNLAPCGTCISKGQNTKLLEDLKNKMLNLNCPNYYFSMAKCMFKSCKCINNTCQDIARYAIYSIMRNPWFADNKIFAIEVQNISLVGAAGTKSGALACAGHGEMTHLVSDGTGETFLCGPEDLKLNIPVEVKAKVHSSTICKEFDDDLRTSIMECGEYYPTTSRDPDNWYFELEYIEPVSA